MKTVIFKQKIFLWITLAILSSVNLQAATDSKPLAEIKMASQQAEVAVKTRLTLKERVALKIGKYILSKNDSPEGVSPAQGKTEILGVVSLGSAVLTFVLAQFSALAAILAILAAIVLGIVSLGKFSKYPGEYKGKGFAWAGLSLGALLLILNVIVAVLVL